MAFLDTFKPSSKRDLDSDSGSQRTEPIWDNDTLTVRQPVSPLAPSAGKHQVKESQMVHSLSSLSVHTYTFSLCLWNGIYARISNQVYSRKKPISSCEAAVPAMSAVECKYSPLLYSIKLWYIQFVKWHGGN